MGDEKDTKKRKSKWATSYSKMTIPEAEKRLGVELTLRAIPVKKMLEGKNCQERLVYRRLGRKSTTA